MKNDKFLVPLSIILAGLIIAGAIFFNGRSDRIASNTAATSTIPTTDAGDNISMAPISPSDHILGNPNAKIILVEYSDLQCPFCQEYSASVNQVMNTYG